jgi:hypothetical protein
MIATVAGLHQQMQKVDVLILLGKFDQIFVDLLEVFFRQLLVNWSYSLLNSELLINGFLDAALLVDEVELEL